MRFLTLFYALLLVCTMKDAYPQLSCSISNIEDSRISYPTFESSNARMSKFKIAINAVIVHPTNGIQIFKEKDIDELITKANEYFEPINYEFYIINSGIKHIYSDEYLNLSIEDEYKLRENNDEIFAINLYLVSTIVLKNKDILSGFSSLPTLNQNGNRIILSYLDRNQEDFQTLKEKVFPHELGHYFGLLHTFQDSGSEIITERELVTRDVGANCAISGDYLCDTPADPYERLHSIASLSCNAPLPDTLLDRLGFTYKPIQGNLMSYQIRCGNSFTPQQYQRMQAAGNIRFSADAEYQIIQQPRTSISIAKLSKNSYCTGEVIELEWSASGFYANDNQFSYEISNKDGGDFKPINGVRVANSTFISLPESLPIGYNYRIKIKAKNPETESYISDHFEVRTKGTYKIDLDKNVVNLGEPVELKVSFSGTGPWNWELSNGVQIKDSYNKAIAFRFFPEDDTKYQLKNVVGACGFVENGNSEQLIVIKPQLSIDNSSNLTFCENQTVSLKVNGLRSNKYKIYVTGSERYLINPNVRDNIVSFLLPQAIRGNAKYILEIIGTDLGDFSPKYNLEIKPAPDQPFVQSPVIACYNQLETKLPVEGERLKWYENPVFDTFSLNPNIQTSEEGTHYFYVSQSNEFGCESQKSKIELIVKPPLTVSISGDNEILKGDSTRLRLQVSGDGPVEVVLNDGSVLNISSSSSEFYFVQPEDSFVYTIKEAKNGCGIGVVSGTATVSVQLPLGVITEPNSNNLILYPNPISNGKISYKIENKKISRINILDLKGRTVPYKIVGQNGIEVLEKGIFVFKATYTDKTFDSRKIVILN